MLIERVLHPQGARTYVMLASTEEGSHVGGAVRARASGWKESEARSQSISLARLKRSRTLRALLREGI